MKRRDFHYRLPDELIAQYPLLDRSSSRLLVLHRRTGKIEDRLFTDLIDYLEPEDLLIFNNTRVLPARLVGKKSTGGRVELLLEHLINAQDLWAHIRANHAPKPGDYLYFKEQKVEVLERKENLFKLRFLNLKSVMPLFYQQGDLPLPPYIKRPQGAIDWERYQTVYAKEEGSVAAPTAGLHYDQAILKAFERKKIRSTFITLHVGAGTFQPIRSEEIKDHLMHAEYISISEAAASIIKKTQLMKKRIIAVGTTSARALESVARQGEIKSYTGETKLFIYPPYDFKCVDTLHTNFHIPESTLLMLVSAFAGKENIFRAYNHAIQKKYRFLSYGDSMLILD